MSSAAANRGEKSVEIMHLIPLKKKMMMMIKRTSYGPWPWFLTAIPFSAVTVPWSLYGHTALYYSLPMYFNAQVFETPLHQARSSQGRNTPIVAGQVGIRYVSLLVSVQ